MMKIQVDKIGVAHEDGRRKLTAVFNDGFSAKQIKVLEVKKTSILGNHYHDYRELFYIYKGWAVFTLVDVKTEERRIVRLGAGDRLIIDPKIAHRVKIRKGTMTVEATEKPYVSPEENDRRYEIE